MRIIEANRAGLRWAMKLAAIHSLEKPCSVVWRDSDRKYTYTSRVESTDLFVCEWTNGQVSSTAKFEDDATKRLFGNCEWVAKQELTKRATTP